MSLLVTEAIVLHSQDYLESSRILRLATREAGVQSVLARGARRSKVRYGSALDLFAEGTAQIQMKDGRDLNTLSAFDITGIRTSLADDIDKFTAASAIAELVLKFAKDDTHPELFDSVAQTLDTLSEANSQSATEIGLAAAWRIVSMLGFAPSTDICANCHGDVAVDSRVAFSHSTGGTLCSTCARFAPGARVLPPQELDVLRKWLQQDVDKPRFVLTDRDPQSIRAHLRLLREFLREHLSDDKNMRAVDVWASGGWS